MEAGTARKNGWHRYSALAFAAAAGLLGVAAPGLANAAKTPSPAQASSDVWPTFGHDPLHSGVSSDTTIGASSAPGLARKWSAPLASKQDQPSPAVAYNGTRKQTLVYDVTYSGVASAFNASTGALVWRHSVGAKVFSSPAVSGNTLYFGTNGGQLEALNAATGAVQCVFTAPTVAGKPVRIFSSPVVGDVDGTGPVVFFGDAGPNSPNETHNLGHFWAVTGVGNTGGNCQEKWAYDGWANKGKKGTESGVWVEPALVQESGGTWAVVFGTSNPDNSVYALNAATGTRLWRFTTPTRGPDEDVSAGPTISPPGSNGFPDGVAYIDGKDGIEYALNLLTGKQIWSYTLGPGSDEAITVSEAALAGNTLVLGYSDTVIAFNASTGAKLWQVTTGGWVQASPAVSGAAGNQVLFVGDLDNDEYGFSLSSGAQVFSAGTAGRIQDSSAVAGGMLYFASDGTLYAYAPGGTYGAGGRDGVRGDPWPDGRRSGFVQGNLLRLPALRG